MDVSWTIKRLTLFLCMVLEVFWFHSFTSGWPVWSPCNPRDSQESSPAPKFESINFLVFNFLYGPTLTSVHEFWKVMVVPAWTFVGKVMSLLFNKLSGLAIAFFPRGKGLLISWLQSSSTVILEPKKVKSVSVSTFSPSICHETVMSYRKCYRKSWSERHK